MPPPPTARGAAAKTAAPGASGALGQYAAKRRFEATPEPAPTVPTRTGPLLFVVQQHAARQLHYDFRLELDGALKSWAVPKGPSLDPEVKRLAVQTEDHPFDYAAFEGVIPPKQYGAGEVIVWDCGVYAPDEAHGGGCHDRAEDEDRVRAALEQGKLSLLLRGEKLKGSFALVRSADPKNWFLIKHRDAYAGVRDITEQNRSVVSGMTVADLKHLPAPEPEPMPASRLGPSGNAETMPMKLAPMLAELAEAPFSHPDWLFEPKLDGYRVLAFVHDGEVKLRSRRGLDLTPAFHAIAAELARQSADMILDGEVLALDASGRPSFNALQNRVQLKTPREIAAAERDTPAVFYGFDLLHFAGLDLRQAAYSDRRRYLAQCLLPSPHVQLVHAAEDGVALHAAALAQGFEGVMAKRRDSRYEAGHRSAAWLKIKPTHSAEFVVGGYTRGRGARAPLGALLLGYWKQGQLRYAGHVGSGLDDATLSQLKQRFAPLETERHPFAEAPPLHRATIWLRPDTVAEVKFAEWTPDGYLRAPVFLRLRKDVDRKSVRRSEPKHAVQLPDTSVDEVPRQLDGARQAFTLAVGPHRIRLTHLDRVYWPANKALKQPALTKRDLLRYLAQVSPWLLPHLADRPLTMVHMPEGIGGEHFFQKHWDPPLPPFAETITVFSESRDERYDYLVCNNLPTLLWLGQSGTLEFHVWHSRARPGADEPGLGTDYSSSTAALERSLLNYPDYLVFDLDPYIYSGQEAAGAEPEYSVAAFDKGRETAFRLREVLQAMGLAPLVKTSGKTGLHIYVPIERTLDFAAVREIAGLVGRHLLRHHPKLITMDWSIAKRSGKIFFDYTMNTRTKTLAAAYSPRGLPGAPVSMPLTWEELETAQPLDFTITTVAARLAQSGDPWRDALTRKQSLERMLAPTKG
ncbi:MAG: DNA ligase D [Thiobacillus sp.]|nr:MAG: DNA ligase D [Hydrogenophilales bacterium 16-64-40]OZA32117.1 MAG: DNA ligase D [Hydrogenophilales bacterium 17-64-65]HQT34367.1 DNA ligase D [Thiobacillus sp.]